MKSIKQQYKYDKENKLPHRYFKQGCKIQEFENGEYKKTFILNNTRLKVDNERFKLYRNPDNDGYTVNYLLTDFKNLKTLWVLDHEDIYYPKSRHNDECLSLEYDKMTRGERLDLFKRSFKKSIETRKRFYLMMYHEKFGPILSNIKKLKGVGKKKLDNLLIMIMGKGWKRSRIEDKKLVKKITNLYEKISSKPKSKFNTLSTDELYKNIEETTPFLRTNLDKE